MAGSHLLSDIHSINIFAFALDSNSHIQKTANRVHVRDGVRRRRHRPECSAASERHRHEKLVGEMGSNRYAGRRDRPAPRQPRVRGNFLGADTFDSESGDDFNDRVTLDHDRRRTSPGPTDGCTASTRQCSRPSPRRSRTMLSSRLAMFSGNEATIARAYTRISPRSSSDTRARARHGSTAISEAPATGRVETAPLQSDVDRCSHPSQDRKKRRRQEVKWRRVRVVRPALECEARRLARRRRARKHGLQDEGRTPGCADRQLIVAAACSRRLEAERVRPELGAGDSRRAHVGRCAHRGQVLSQQSRLLPAGADLLDAKRYSGHERERERCPYRLAPRPLPGIRRL